MAHTGVEQTYRKALLDVINDLHSSMATEVLHGLKATERAQDGPADVINGIINGEGRTDRAIDRYGNEWRAHMPRETRGYIDYDPAAPNYGGYRQMVGAQAGNVTINIDARGNQQPQHLERAVESGVRRGLSQANTMVTTQFAAAKSPDV